MCFGVMNYDTQADMHRKYVIMSLPFVVVSLATVDLKLLTHNSHTSVLMFFVTFREYVLQG